MNAHVFTAPRWTTASVPDATDTAPAELHALGAHVSRCNGCKERWFSLRCAADTVNDFVAGRFITTLLIAAAAIGLAAAVL